jgi:quercetin dioxygenase-like cupin family protein
MDIKRSGSPPSTQGPEAYCTGHVRIDPLFQAAAPGHVLGVFVTFEPGARTAWHTHPLGQHVLVTSGCGWVQCWGGPKKEIRPSDVIACLPGEPHWHGATGTTGMSHIAMQEQLDGQAVEWLEKVSDAHYLATSQAA